MKIKVLKKCYAGTGKNLLAGEEHDMDVRTAERLIAAGYATLVKTRAPKKTTRAITELETPEGEE